MQYEIKDLNSGYIYTVDGDTQVILDSRHTRETPVLMGEQAETYKRVLSDVVRDGDVNFYVCDEVTRSESDGPTWNLSQLVSVVGVDPETGRVSLDNGNSFLAAEALSSKQLDLIVAHSEKMTQEPVKALIRDLDADNDIDNKYDWVEAYLKGIERIFGAPLVIG